MLIDSAWAELETRDISQKSWCQWAKWGGADKSGQKFVRIRQGNQGPLPEEVLGMLVEPEAGNWDALEVNVNVLMF